MAAGQSKRLKKHTEERPKCLVKVAGRSILERQLDAINCIGIDRVLIIAGFMAEKIKEFVAENHDKYDFLIEVVENKLFETTDNAYSLSLGLDRSYGPIIILDGDIVFDKVLFKMLYDYSEDNTLLCDSSRIPEEEDCKILIDDGCVKGIGKKVQGQSVYTSMIKLDGNLLLNLREEINKDRRNKEWYSEPLDRVLRSNKNKLRVIFTDGHYHTEIDTDQDLDIAEREVTARGLQ